MREMSRPMIATFIFSFVLLILSIRAENSDGVPLKLNETNNGQSVELTVGQEVDIALDENPSTGYQWEIVSMDKSIIEKAGEPRFKIESNLIGAGGKKTFHFKAAALGETLLKIIYHRSWEKDVPPIRTFEITIIVK